MKDLIVRAARADDYIDVYEIMACPGVVRNTMQLHYVCTPCSKRALL